MGRKRKNVTFAREGTNSDACPGTIGVGELPGRKGSKKKIRDPSLIVCRRSSRLSENVAQVTNPVVEHLDFDEDEKVEDRDSSTFDHVTKSDVDLNIDVNDKKEDQGPKQDSKFTHLTKPVMEHLNIGENNKEDDLHYKKDTAASEVTKPVVEHLNLDENSKAEDQHINQDATWAKSDEKCAEKQPQADIAMSFPVVNEENVEAEDEYFVQSVDVFKSNNSDQVAMTTRSGPYSDFSYKKLYISAQKKIEALMEEKFALLSELQFARGKISAYERMDGVRNCSKEVIVVPGLANAISSRVHLSPQGLQNCAVPSSDTDLDANENQNASPGKGKKYGNKRKRRRY